MGGTALEKSSLAVTLRLQWAAKHHLHEALVYSGEEGNFMDINLTHKLKIPVVLLTHLISVNALVGQPLSSITHQSTRPVSLFTSDNHTEEIHFFYVN